VSEEGLISHERRGLQQPLWENPDQVLLVRRLLGTCPALAPIADVDTLRRRLSEVARGELLVLQIGDCAEDPAEQTAEHVAAKTGLLEQLADLMTVGGGVPVLKVGRIAGQFAKPRSKDTESINGTVLPSYRGHLVNGPDPDPVSRRPDPLRMITGFHAAAQITGRLDRRPAATRAGRSVVEPTVWTSHEALLLDYEEPLVREHSDGRSWLSSTHWPWIGERTRQLDGPHLDLMARISNPVACKVGPGMSVDEIARLCDLLDPDREAGRLTLISRMGAALIENLLPRLVTAVRSAGHPVIWLCDPMHGNSTLTPDGRKTRHLSAVVREVQVFRRVVEQAGGTAGGLHLETTPDDVHECIDDLPGSLTGSGRWTSLCDPRLNPTQAAEVVNAWAAALDPVAVARFMPGGPTGD